MKPEARPRFMTLVTDRMFVLRAVRNQVPLIRRYFFGAFIDRRHPTNRRFNQNQLRRIVMTEFFRVLRKSGGLFFSAVDYPSDNRWGISFGFCAYSSVHLCNR